MEFLDYREQAAMPQDNGTGGGSASILGAAGSALQNGAGGRGKAPGEGKVLPVQFQPSSLRFQAGHSQESSTKGNIAKPEGADSDKRENARPEEPGSLTMSVSLIFDRSIYVDNDVSRQVEGFLAAARNPFTRQVSFNWGSLYYKGRITDIQADYEMFGSAGVPVRAKLDLTIALDDTAEIAAGKGSR